MGPLDDRPWVNSQYRYLEQNELSIKFFFRRLSFNSLLAKTLRVEYNCHEKVSEESVVRIRRETVSPNKLIDGINTYNASGVMNTP